MDKTEKTALLAQINANVPTVRANMVRNAETNPNMDLAMRKAILKLYGKRTDAEIDAIFAACPSVRK